MAEPFGLERENIDVLIIGGGLAGLVHATLLARLGHQVILLEKKDYPRHKVCGEYISNEVRPLLESVDLYPAELSPVSISEFQLTSSNGKEVATKLKIGGFGISRYTLDNYLFDQAQSAGVKVLTKTSVSQVDYFNDHFITQTTSNVQFKSRVVIGAHGKRSAVDKALDRSFIKNHTTYVGVKRHFEFDHPSELVSLHNFDGGYCGISMVEQQRINACYLTSSKVFNSYSGLEEFEYEHFKHNLHLHKFFQNAQPLMPRPVVISQINFSAKPLIEQHVLMIGDSAGLIHPLCGNGMAMAIHAAFLAANEVHSFLTNAISRAAMETEYSKNWQANFANRLMFGRGVSRLFGSKVLSNLAVDMASAMPGVFKRSVALSHGNYIHPKLAVNE